VDSTLVPATVIEGQTGGAIRCRLRPQGVLANPYTNPKGIVP
jgi:hypothetical protein